jgi:twinkle protein|tara:strand:- start:306 stop:2066 length:1761 start_codon:yes stop_codon:yes gene_type:complete
MRIDSIIRGAIEDGRPHTRRINCPFCDNTRKKRGQRTMSVTPKDNVILYNCWHCDAQGSVSVSHKSNQFITENRGFEVPKTNVKSSKELSANAIKFLKERGISKDTAEKAGVGSRSHYIRSLGEEVECITFPYQYEGKVYAQKIRSIRDKGFACDGSPKSFFNIHNVDVGDSLILCEGEMDALAFIEAGYESVVSVPNGAVMKVSEGRIDPEDDNKFRFLWAAKAELEKAERIVIATDSDSAGQAMAEEIARRIGKDRCWKIEYPDGCKDANDILMKHGKKGLDDVASNCKPWPVSGLYDAEHFYEQVDEIYQKGMGRGESTGYSNVDDLYTIVGGQLTVVTGIPSSGKSEFIDQIMINLAEQKDWKFAICSFENEPRLHIAKLASKHIRKPFFDGPTQRMNDWELSQAKGFVQRHFCFLYQADGSLATLEHIIERLKIAVLRYGVRGAIIDPYNYIHRPSNVSETEWVSDMLTKLRIFAQAHDIHIWFVAHPTKMMRGQDGKIPVPKGYDISGSAAWFAKADCGLSVHRPDPTAVASEIHIWKCRFSWIGKQGMATLNFDKTTSRYLMQGYDPILNPNRHDGVPF